MKAPNRPGRRARVQAGGVTDRSRPTIPLPPVQPPRDEAGRGLPVPKSRRRRRGASLRGTGPTPLTARRREASMSFGKRRPKLSRAQLRPTNPIAIQQGRLARQRDRLARLAVVATAVLVTAAIVHGSGTPSPCGLGQRPSRELRVNVPEFHRLNQKKTNAARQMVVDQVATSMINDPAPISDLAGRLVELTVAVASAPRFDALPAGLRNAWKLDQATFDELKSATDTPARRDALPRQIEEAFAPLIRDGVLGPDTLPRNEEASRNLSVRQARQKPGDAHFVPRERVVPERIAQPEGTVAQEFITALPP